MPTKSLTVYKSPFYAATCNVEYPCGSLTCTFAPFYNKREYIYFDPKSIANIMGAGAGQVISPLGLAPLLIKILIASKLTFPAAQFIGFP